MWLWKKFKNTDIIGKIYILIILFIVVVATITIITRYKNANTNQNVNEQNNQVNEVIEDTTISDMDIGKENIVTAVNLEENKQEEVKESVQTKSDSKVKKVEDVVTNKSSSTSLTSSKTESEGIVDKEQINNEIEQTNNKDEIKQKEQQTEPKEEKQKNEGKENASSQENIREVKRNDTYIQKIKDYITTNDKSSYSIEIDPSVVNTSFGFTYSEFNLSGYIGAYSVYRIYAQDYYVNGQYVETRCYID